MSRRNQSRRRRTYGRRQHEVRERQPGHDLRADWSTELEPRDAWLGTDGSGDQRSYEHGFEGFDR